MIFNDLKILLKGVLLLAALLLAGCSGDFADPHADEFSRNDDEPAVVDAIDISADLTRANYLSLTRFSISVYNVKAGGLLADKLQYVQSGTGMSSSSTWRMVNYEMKAIAASPTLDDMENILLDANNQSFDYTVPTTNQSMVKIGGNLSFTRKSVNNQLSLKFVNALSLFNIRARNELEVVDKDNNTLAVTIYVKGFTLHNIAAKGRFVFTGDYAGAWTAIDDVYYNYTQILANPIELATTTYKQVADSQVVVLPQSPELNSWAPEGLDDPSDAYAAANGIAKADSEHKAYIELLCSMTTERDGKTIYLWGTENSYTPIYFPYIGSYCPKKWNSINRQGVYNLRILKGEAFDSNGRPIKPQAQENGESFENAEFINIAPTDENGNDNVDDWEDPDPYNVTI